MYQTTSEHINHVLVTSRNKSQSYTYTIDTAIQTDNARKNYYNSCNFPK